MVKKPKIDLQSNSFLCIKRNNKSKNRYLENFTLVIFAQIVCKDVSVHEGSSAFT